jgi:hypothetical protein
MAAVPETDPLGVSIETLEIVLPPLVVVPVIGITGNILPRRSVKLPLVAVMLVQLVAPLQKLSPTLTVVTYGTMLK